MSDDRADFILLYERFHPQVYAYCRRRISSDVVEDAVSETFLAAWRKRQELPRLDDALPWLYGAAYRVLSHQWRNAARRGRLNEKLGSLGVSTLDLPEDVIVIREEGLQLLAALDALNDTDKEILRLTAWEELTQAEIASALGVTIGAVRQRLHHAKQKLADEYNRLEKRRATSPAAQKGGVW